MGTHKIKGRGKVWQLDADAGSSELDNFVIQCCSSTWTAVPFKFQMAVLEVLNLLEPDVKPFSITLIKCSILLDITNLPRRKHFVFSCLSIFRELLYTVVEGARSNDATKFAPCANKIFSFALSRSGLNGIVGSKFHRPDGKTWNGLAMGYSLVNEFLPNGELVASIRFEVDILGGSLVDHRPDVATSICGNRELKVVKIALMGVHGRNIDSLSMLRITEFVRGNYFLLDLILKDIVQATVDFAPGISLVMPFRLDTFSKRMYLGRW